MLERCHVGSLDELYSDVPDSLRLKRPYSLPKAMSEPELGRYFKTQIGDANKPLRCFAGAGWYHHYCPAAVQSLLLRSEFLTAYTPYQPEISQGTLQYIFEYQSMMCELTGMDVSNASMYDGATATAEAVEKATSRACVGNTCPRSGPGYCHIRRRGAHNGGGDSRRPWSDFAHGIRRNDMRRRCCRSGSSLAKLLWHTRGL